MMRRNFDVIKSAATIVFCLAAIAQAQTRRFDAVRIPPGVTPLTATQADSLTQQLFVARAQEVQAESLVVKAEEYRVQSDSLWSVLALADAARRPISREDSLAALRETLDGYNKMQKGLPVIEQYLKAQDEKKRLQAVGMLQQAEVALRRAVALNPYFTHARVLLASVYKLLAQRLPDRSRVNYDQAITTWETIVRLQPGEYQNYFDLALNYYAVKAYSPALTNFEQAEQKLLAGASVQDSRIADPAQPVAAVVDSARLFLSVFYQSQCAIKRNDAKQNDEAKVYASLERARQFAHTPQYRSLALYFKRWMDWDRGNIVGATMRDSTAILSARGEFAKAAKIYEDMIPKLRSESARHEFGWKLALVEFSSLKRKPEAAERMLRIVKAIPTDSLGVPTRSDTLAQTYFDNFATMCVNLGSENLEINRKLAYTYFLQSASLHWAGRGKSYLAMASLADASPKQVIADGEKAYQLAHQLDADEVINLHKLLIRNYRRLGLFEKAKLHFDEMVRRLGVNAAEQPGL